MGIQSPSFSIQVLLLTPKMSHKNIEVDNMDGLDAESQINTMQQSYMKLETEMKLEAATSNAAMSNAHTAFNVDDANLDRKDRLIQKVLYLQKTHDNLTSKVDAVKDEGVKLRSENKILGQYIENLVAAYSVFQEKKGRRTSRRSGDINAGLFSF